MSFNLRRPNGEWVGYGEVERIASMENIHLRTGCFCNPGACHSYLNLSAREVQENLEVILPLTLVPLTLFILQAGHVCWDGHDIMNGKPVGAIRVSLGYMSNFEDVDVRTLSRSSYIYSAVCSLIGFCCLHRPCCLLFANISSK